MQLLGRAFTVSFSGLYSIIQLQLRLLIPEPLFDLDFSPRSLCASLCLLLPQMRRSSTPSWKTTDPPVHKATKDTTALTAKVPQAESSVWELFHSSCTFYSYSSHVSPTEQISSFTVRYLFFNFTRHFFSNLKDINECSMQGVCQNGDCLNTLGSFKCSCKAGMVLERNRCVGELQASAGFPPFSSFDE